ncbi:MAG: hypothetical protein Q4C85_05715 [Actinomyces sp.]|nr:hypothetical protein [Actinomyces sp.]
MVVEPARQLDLPGDRRLDDRVDLLQEPCGQQAAALGLVEQQPLAQLVAAEGVQVGVPGGVGRAQAPVRDVALATRQGTKPAHATDVGDEAVIHLLGRQAAQLGVVEQSEGGATPTCIWMSQSLMTRSQAAHDLDHLGRGLLAEGVQGAGDHVPRARGGEGLLMTRGLAPQVVGALAEVVDDERVQAVGRRP